MNLPRLTAEEALRMTHVVAAGAGHLAADDHRALMRRWEAQAAGNAQRVRSATPSAMRAIGIGVRVVKRS